MKCNWCGSSSFTNNKCDYCNTIMEEKIEEVKKLKVVKWDMWTYKELYNTHLKWDMNAINYAENCIIEWDMNTIMKSKNIEVIWDMNNY